MQNCIGCLIVSGKTKSFKVYEDDEFVAVLDIRPAVVGQLFILTKKHYDTIFQMSDAEIERFFKVASTIGKALVSLGAKGVSIIAPVGQVAGQIIPHANIIIIPRYGDEEVYIGWKPKEVKPEELLNMQKSLLSVIPKFLQKKEEIIEEKPKEKEKEEIIEEEEEIPNYW